jgi:hypothetical protein
MYSSPPIACFLSRFDKTFIGKASSADRCAVDLRKLTLMTEPFVLDYWGLHVIRLKHECMLPCAYYTLSAITPVYTSTTTPRSKILRREAYR